MSKSLLDNNTPSVSVIIPLYNKEKWIGRAIRSVLMQTYQYFELIVINDGSTDNSYNVANLFKSDDRVRVLTQNNQGLPTTRNRGISESKFRLITFLDADDEWLPDFLETVIHMYMIYPNAGLYATSYEHCVGNRVKRHSVWGLSNSYEGYLESYFKLAPYYPFCAISVAIPKETFDIVGCFNTRSKMAEDNEMWTKIAFYLPICYTSRVCARYYTVPDQMSRSFYVAATCPVIEYINSIDKSELINYKHLDDLNGYLESACLGWAYFNIGAGAMKIAREFLLSIHLPQYRMRKIILLVVSYLPFCSGRGVVLFRRLIQNVQSYFWKRKEAIPYDGQVK